MNKAKSSCMILIVLFLGGLFAGCGTAKPQLISTEVPTSVPTATLMSTPTETPMVTPTSTPTPTNTPTPTPSPTPTPVVIEFTITAAGDVTLGRTQKHTYEGSFDEYYDVHGEEYFFENVDDIFQEDDFTIINLECVLTNESIFRRIQSEI